MKCLCPDCEKNLPDTAVIEDGDKLPIDNDFDLWNRAEVVCITTDLNG